MFRGILFVSQLVLVVLDAWATGFLRRQKLQWYILDLKNRSSGTDCEVTLFKTKVISRVNVEYQFANF